jgi:hypothetical protein
MKNDLCARLPGLLALAIALISLLLAACSNGGGSNGGY